MRKTKKKKPLFTIVIAIVISIFTSITLLSIPFLYDYKSKEIEIENKFYSEFKINLKIIDNISYNYFPKPHLLIKKAKLSLNINDEKLSISDTKNLKIFIPLNSIYNKSNFNMSGLEINNTNFKFKFSDIKKFRDHLFFRINKPIKIKKSKFFYIDKNNKTILISPIHSLNYSIKEKNRHKSLKINGNIFDVDYKSIWKRHYDSPKITHHEINFKNPNLFIKNLFSFQGKSNYGGKSEISFLKKKINIEYNVNEDKIFIKSLDEIKNQEIKILSNIELNPFYFDSEIELSNKDSKFLIDNFLNYLMNVNEDIFGNISGKVVVKLKNLDNEIIDNGIINLIINEKSLKIDNTKLEIKNIGFIKSIFSFYEKEGELIFKSKNVLEVTNKKEFGRKFQLNLKKAEKVDKIYFDLEKNIEKDKFSIFNIYVNKIDAEQKYKETIYLKNIQLLKSLLNNILN